MIKIFLYVFMEELNSARECRSFYGSTIPSPNRIMIEVPPYVRMKLDEDTGEVFVTLQV